MRFETRVGAAAVLLAVLAGAGITAFAGEAPANGKLPLGSRDFCPSPERPFGWRGDGNGRYPAAGPSQGT